MCWAVMVCWPQSQYPSHWHAVYLVRCLQVALGAQHPADSGSLPSFGTLPTIGWYPPVLA